MPLKAAGCKEARSPTTVRRLMMLLVLGTYSNCLYTDKQNSNTCHQEPLFSVVNRRQLAWFGHTTRHGIVCEVIIQGRAEDERRRGRQRQQSWNYIIKEWTGCSSSTRVYVTDDKESLLSLITDVFIVTPQRPATGVKG